MNSLHYRLLDPPEYLFDHLIRGLHPDGRSLTDFRSASLQTNLISSANGSALVRLGDAVIVAAIKGEIVDERTSLLPIPSNDAQLDTVDKKNKAIKSGRVMFHIEGQPYFDDAFNNEISRTTSILQNLLDENKLVDLDYLDIGQNINVFWSLYVDVTVLNCDGVLLDACLLAVVAALRSTTLPVVTLETEDDGIECADSVTNRSLQTLFPDKVCIKDNYHALRCVGEMPPASCSFLLLNSDDFDQTSLQYERPETKKENDCCSHKTFITSDPVEFERNLFPNNTLTIIVGDRIDEKVKSKGKQKYSNHSQCAIYGIYKYGGTCSVDEKILDQCLSLAIKRKLQLDKLLTDAQVKDD